MTFGRDITSLTDVIEETGPRFTDNSKDLLVLDLADPAVIDTTRQIKSLGQEQCDTYANERLVNQTKPIADSIKRNTPPLISRPPVREKSRTQLQLSRRKYGMVIWISSFSMKTRSIHLRYHKRANCGHCGGLCFPS